MLCGRSMDRKKLQRGYLSYCRKVEEDGYLHINSEYLNPIHSDKYFSLS